jgi:hypothetical protein
MESEERGERRGLEQRAAGLIAALLVVFPVAGSIAKEADTDSAVGIIGLALLAGTLGAAVWIARELVPALAPKRKKAPAATSRPTQSPTRVTAQTRSLPGMVKSLGDDLSLAVESQAVIVKHTRRRNNRMVREIQRATRFLPWTLLALLVSLGLIISSSVTRDGENRQKPPTAERSP